MRLTINVWYSTVYGHWIAECSESGNVATANTQDLAVRMILEILKDEADIGNLPGMGAAVTA